MANSHDESQDLVEERLMGTSRSHPGAGGGTPLVPSWANEAAGESAPIPAEAPRRFVGFRTALGKFVASGGPESMRGALRSYARTASGGAGAGARRIAPATKALGTLFSAIGAAQGSGTTVPETGGLTLDLAQLTGAPVEQAIEAILDVLCPPGGPTDAEMVRAAMNEALAQMLASETTFDAAEITRDDAIVLLERYIGETLYSRIAVDGSKAFERTTDPVALVRAENELRTFIAASVGAHLSEVLPLGGDLFSAAGVERAIAALVDRVWSDWREMQ